jgi:hypothetical protein
VKVFRWTAILMLILYSGLVLGMDYHSHKSDQQISVHCKICDFSQASSDSPSHFASVLQMNPMGMVPSAIVVLQYRDMVHSQTGRSPPLS